MNIQSPFVHSNFDRIENDDYQTIDKRCIYGFLEYFTPSGLCIDVCSSNGSGIIDTLKECGYDKSIYGIDAFDDKSISAQWIITNPPYTRGLVDKIINRQIKRMDEEEISGLAILLRSNFDFAKSRWDMFHHYSYCGQIKLLFRPWWSDDKSASPIHNFVWHIWKLPPSSPIVRYARGIKTP